VVDRRGRDELPEASGEEEGRHDPENPRHDDVARRLCLWVS
jgi:hypothetical protein